jgi:hypothetical protein
MEWWTGKDLEGSGRGNPNFRAEIFLERVRKTKTNLGNVVLL